MPAARLRSTVTPAGVVRALRYSAVRLESTSGLPGRQRQVDGVQGPGPQVFGEFVRAVEDGQDQPLRQ
ncbi:hypothetical protein [Streptomyces sp. NPDC001340]